ncbi:uncharacterized protein LOC103521292 [Diaphorina citri]|uniref:Uncharacterized protein LOC103521292 n=1 Tax=Diaphorina citri TaxID=121845 RepID=A0A1S3DM44_DIACI|nr:uncharacterized protein LOC103521292 [Diaphorina citri]
MKSIFARHGIPKLVVCDSGSQFTSREFKDFSVQYEFDFICSSPYHHKSNGLAESHVKIIKNLLKKAQSNGSDPYLALLNFRNTPKNNSPSPAQLLFSRALRTKIPVTYDYLKPNVKPRNVNVSSHYSSPATTPQPSPDMSPTGYQTRFGRNVRPPNRLTFSPFQP